ncbi:MAG: hypothetical protein H6968_13655 [Chromatiaceae bacterium]|nr:hypothetical protein [Chromatiaceae bacterium]
MDDHSKDFRCYSVRRLNPFLGVAQIVESTDSRAISLDGVDWDIQILAERPHDTWGAPSPVKQKRLFLRFGAWNRTNGLYRVPANPLLDLAKMIKEANRLIEILLLKSARVPFPLEDSFELWLLDDEDHMPQALLASTHRVVEISLFAVDRWICTNQDPPATDMTQHKETESDSNGPHPHKIYLEAIVQQRASQGIRRWFKRIACGYGEPVPPVFGEEVVVGNGLLPAEAFPQLLLNGSWDDPLACSVISDYHAWLSPYLLTLQNLPDDLRASLERKAVARAAAVNLNWRLYPKIIDGKLIDAARVEARLRESHKG